MASKYRGVTNGKVLIVNTKEAPEVTGLAIPGCSWEILSQSPGQLGLVSETGKMLEGIEAQTKQALLTQNKRTVLAIIMR